MVIVHLVARLRSPRRDLRRFEPAAWLWRRIEVQFPQAIARVIMPNHPHLLTPVNDASEAMHRFARICGHLQRRLRIPDLFEPIPPPEIVEPSQVRRAARYIELNPCRSNLVLHPAEWLFTSLRDIAGATAPTSVNRRSHAAFTRSQPDAWVDYVVRDERVLDRRSLADPVPGDRTIPAFGLETIAAAVAAATRRSPAELRSRGPIRDLFLAAARDQGLTDTALLAQACACTPRTIQAARHRDPPGGLPAVRRCLADPRLLRPVLPEVRRRFKALEGLRRAS